MTRKSLKLNTILNSVRMTLTILVPLLTYPYVTRIFGSDGIGKYEWVKSVVSIFTLLASLGITTYAVREGAKIRDDRKKFTQFAHELFIINLCATIVCYIVLFILIQSVPRFSLYREYLLIYSVNIGLSALSLDWVYSVYEDYAYITIRQIIVQIISVAGLFLLVHKQQDLIIYIIITTVSNSGANIFNFIRAKKYVDFNIHCKYNLTIHLVPVLVFFGTRFAMNAYNSLDTVVLGMLSTNDAVGYYNVAVKINTILVTFFTALSPVYLPRMTTYLSRENTEDYTNLLCKVIRLKTFLIYPTVCGLFVFSKQIIWLIAGDGFEPASFTLKILSLVLGCVLLSSIVQRDILIPYGKEAQVLALTLVAAVLNLLFSSFLILNVDYNGAAWGSLIAECTILIVGMWSVKRKKIDLFSTLMRYSWKYLVSSIIMGGWCIALNNIVKSNLSIIIFGIPSAALVYFLALTLMRDSFFCQNSKEILAKIISYSRKR